jgi:hypothetical protein
MRGALFEDGWQRFLRRLRRLWGELRNRGPLGGVSTRGAWRFREFRSESRQLDRWDDDGGASIRGGLAVIHPLPPLTTLDGTTPLASIKSDDEFRCFE